MKRCNACDQKFADKFSFCPVDGTPLNRLAGALVGRESESDPDYRNFGNEAPAVRYATRSEFNVTMISSAGLGRRLATEVSFVIEQLQRAWPDFKRDPIGLGRQAVIESARRLKRLVVEPNALAATVTAILLVLSAVLTLILLEHAPKKIRLADQNSEEPVQVVTLNFPASTTPPEGAGVGVNSNGRVGLATGRGEGSESQPQRSRGGGGGGDHNPLPQGPGKVPQPSDIPAPINPSLPNAALPVAGVDLDPALWRNLPFAAYGDPRSKSATASNGPGNGGGIGTGNGQGIGEGNGNGFGPGDDGNMGGGHKARGNGGSSGANGSDPRDINRIFSVKDVTQRAKVITKPEPQYTEEARRNQITGTVVLRVVFSAAGEVTNIHPIKSLPAGLTEKAIAAARQIRFVPATRNGQPVPVYMQLEYNFNLY